MSASMVAALPPLQCPLTILLTALSMQRSSYNGSLLSVLRCSASLPCFSLQVICMMVPYDSIDPNAPYSTAFTQVGMFWARSGSCLSTSHACFFIYHGNSCRHSGMVMSASRAGRDSLHWILFLGTVGRGLPYAFARQLQLSPLEAHSSRNCQKQPVPSLAVRHLGRCAQVCGGVHGAGGHFHSIAGEHAGPGAHLDHGCARAPDPALLGQSLPALRHPRCGPSHHGSCIR